MIQLPDIKAFLTTARTQSFSAAAREMGLAPSALTKRVSRLEETVGTPLFARSTRRVTLTAEGERLRPRLQLVLGDLEAALRGVQRDNSGVSGQLRIKSPTTVGALHVGAALARFLTANPNVTAELVLMDQAINPVGEGFDVALGALPASFAGVTDIPLCAYERVLVATPGYLAGRTAPSDPNDLADHDCLAFLPIGSGWSFESRRGTILVEVRARLAVNESHALFAAVLEGLGIAAVPRFIAREALETRRVVALLPDFPLSPLWFKALVPRSKLHLPEVAALVEHLVDEFGPVPPWDR